MLIFFMVFDAASFPQRAEESAKLRPDLVSALGRFVWGTQQYLIVSTIFGAIVAVLDTIALYLIGVPLAALWGLLAFITNYIPNVGFVIGLVPPALLALLGGGVGDMVTVIAVYCLFNLVLQSIIQPRFVGESVGLATTLTFVSLIFWGWVLGPLGAILAVPMTLLAKALLVDIDPAAGWAIPFIGSGPPVAPAPRAPDGSAPAEDDSATPPEDDPATQPEEDPAAAPEEGEQVGKTP
jgi:predicted PurR-regulated permease PerM